MSMWLHRVDDPHSSDVIGEPNSYWFTYTKGGKVTEVFVAATEYYEDGEQYQFSHWALEPYETLEHEEAPGNYEQWREETERWVKGQ